MCPLHLLLVRPTLESQSSGEEEEEQKSKEILKTPIPPPFPTAAVLPDTGPSYRSEEVLN